jgi:hypothetical protein
MPVSFELDSVLEDEEELTSLVHETVDGQPSLNGSRRGIRPSSKTHIDSSAVSGKRKYVVILLILGLILFIVAYPRGDETVDEAVDTIDKPDSENENHNLPAVVPLPAPVPATEPPVAPLTQSPTLAPTTPKTVDRPGTGPVGAPGWKWTQNRLSDKYLPKAQQTMTPEQRQEMIQQWGQWTFVDPKPSTERPQDDFYAKYPNRDVPRSEFPPNAWQLDADYLENFLDAGLELVTRAQEAILAEYGRGKVDMPGVDFDERSKLFYVNMVNLTSGDWDASANVVPGAAGWHDQTGWENLQRRILHAIMTEDSFTYLMGGHSAAAGHGNHFWQSYTLQMGRIIEPVFARLGVFFKAHNIGMGGLGTGHNAMGAKDIYGTDVDILYWDSGMTENTWQHHDLFMRANLISGGKVPVIWGALGNLIKDMARNYGVDIGLIASGQPGYQYLPEVLSLVEAADTPWAFRYMRCTGDFAGECGRFKYNVQCWIDRPDVTPAAAQHGTNPGGQANWHPGWRHHQIVGRTLAFVLLRATRQALNRWKETDGFILPDEAWHVTAHYEAIRTKTLAYNNSFCRTLPCHDLFCEYPMNARTEFTPRVNGYSASIRSIMKLGGTIRKPPANHYDPPDVPMAHAEIPDGQVDVLSIIESGVDFATNRARKKHAEWLLNPPAYEFKSQNYITPGKGTYPSNSVGASDNCDGTWDSFCNRAASSQCLLWHHNDGRNGLLMDSVSGWLVLDIANVVKGLIVVKIETWHQPNENAVTYEWTCENNECPPARHLRTGNDTVPHPEVSRAILTSKNSTRAQTMARQLGAPPTPCEEFRFEFAIDGKITSWTHEEFESRRTEIQRVVNVWTLFDDPSYVVDGPKDVELALRLTGCGYNKEQSPTFSLTHVYWA